MIRRVFLILLLVILSGQIACEKKNRFEGYLWFGQKDRIAIYDLADNRLKYPQILAGCNEAAAGPLGKNFAFVCTTPNGNVLRSFETGQLRPADTMAVLEERLSDATLSPDGSRTLFRIQKSGDVYDSYLLFRESNFGKLLGRIGSVTFGPDNQTIYVAQGKKLAVHVIDDITRPAKVPEGGLRAIYNGSETIRDVDFHLGIRKIAFCEGSRVIVTDLTGKGRREIFDATKIEFSGALRMPYRVRWAPRGDYIAVMVSDQGNKGSFVILDYSGTKYVRIEKITANIGSFAWTTTRPTSLK